MTTLLDEAVACLHNLPRDDQDRLARLLLAFANDDGDDARTIQ